MVNIDGNDINLNFNKNGMEFDEINSVYSDSPDLNFADDEGDSPLSDNSTPISEVEDYIVDSPESEVVSPTDEISSNGVVSVEGDEETVLNSNLPNQNKRRLRNDESPEIVKAKKQRTTIEKSGNDIRTFFPIEKLVETDEDLKNILEEYNKLFSSTKYPRICPYKSLKEIDETIPIKSKSGLSLLFPINAFLDRKKKYKKPLSWDFDKIQTIDNTNSFTEDKLLCKEAEDLIKQLEESTVPPQPLPVSDELMPKTEYEKTFLKNIMPRIGYDFIYQPGKGKMEKEKWLRLKEIDASNGIEWTEMDIGYDIVNCPNS